jgi:hypothetical protein
VTRSPRPTARLLLALLAVAVAAAVRWRAVERLPPDYDELDYIPCGYLYAERMAPGRWGEIPEVSRNREHPPLVKLCFAVALKASGAPEPDAQALEVGRPMPPEARPAFTVTRALSAVAGTLQVALVALLTPVGGLWLALDTYHAKYSAQAYLEALPGLLALLALLLFERATPRPERDLLAPHRPRVRPGSLLASSALLGLAAAGKYPYGVVIGLALLPLLVLRLRSRPRLLAAYAAVTALAFLAADPALWPDPLGRLWASIGYHWAYPSSENVRRAGLPWWWQLHWLTRPAPASWHPGVFPVPWLDYALLPAALLGVPRAWRERPAWLSWAAVAMLFLLVWPVKWPQYTLLARVPLAAMAGWGLEAVVARWRGARPAAAEPPLR